MDIGRVFKNNIYSALCLTLMKAGVLLINVYLIQFVALITPQSVVIKLLFEKVHVSPINITRHTPSSSVMQSFSLLFLFHFSRFHNV